MKQILPVMLFLFSCNLLGETHHELWEDATVKIYSFGMMDAQFVETNDGKKVPMAYPELSHGSGFIISQNGVIVTNAHVIKIDGQKSESISVKLKDMEKTFPAAVIYSDDEHDIAFLKIDLNYQGLFFDLNDSTINDSWEKGDKVWLWGFPMDPKEHDVSLSEGIINRKVEESKKIQISATANPGNSGGPAVDENNRLLGVIHAKRVDAENYNLLIPASDVLKIYKEVLKGGYIARAEKEFTSDRWEVVSLWSEIGTRMINDLDVSKQFESLMKMRSDLFPEAFVFFAGVIWNDGMKKIINGSNEDGFKSLINAVKLIKEAISIKPDIRENGFINYALNFYEDLEKEAGKQSSNSEDSYKYQQKEDHQSNNNSSKYKNTSGFDIRHHIDLNISPVSILFYSREGAFGKLIRNEMDESEKDKLQLNGAGAAISMSFLFDTNSIYAAEWLYFLSGFTISFRISSFNYIADPQTEKIEEVRPISATLMQGFNFRPVRWFYTTIYWNPYVSILKKIFDPKGAGINIGFVMGKGFVLGMKGYFFKDSYSDVYTHGVDFNLGWSFLID